MLSTIIWYFLFITLSLSSALASTSKNWARPRPWPRSRPQSPGLGLEILASFNITDHELPYTGSLMCEFIKNIFKKVKTDMSLPGEPHLKATGHRFTYGITQCYLPPYTSERTLPNPSHTGWYSIYLPRRDGRLRWSSWLDSAPAGSRTSDLPITSPTPNRCATKTTIKCHKGFYTNMQVMKNVLKQGSCPFVKVKFNDFSRTFKDHTKDI